METTAWDEYVAEVGEDAAQEQTLVVWAAVKTATKDLADRGIIANEHELFNMFCEHCIDKHVRMLLVRKVSLS